MMRVQETHPGVVAAHVIPIPEVVISYRCWHQYHLCRKCLPSQNGVLQSNLTILQTYLECIKRTKNKCSQEIDATHISSSTLTITNSMTLYRNPLVTYEGQICWLKWRNYNPDIKFVLQVIHLKLKRNHSRPKYLQKRTRRKPASKFLDSNNWTKHCHFNWNLPMQSRFPFIKQSENEAGEGRA